MPLVARVEVRAVHPVDDPSAGGVLGEIRQVGRTDVAAVKTARVFLLQGDAAVLTPEAVERIAREVLIDPVTETFVVGGGGTEPADGGRLIEVHLKPGVTDPVATSAEMAIADLLKGSSGQKGEGGREKGEDDAATRRRGDAARGTMPVEVRTGRKYVLFGAEGGAVSDETMALVAKRVLVNESIENGFFEPFVPAEFPKGHRYEFHLTHVPIRGLSDEQLLELSRRGHLFLDLREMKAIQDYFRSLDRDPTDAELETLAQTWSEHCVHKTLKATVEFTFVDRRREGRNEKSGGTSDGVTECGSDGVAHGGTETTPALRNSDTPTPSPSTPVIIDNLVKSTIFQSTMELNKDWTLNVFKDNAGVIAFDDHHAVCMKVETHNRPSAIEPYGGAATGIGGVIRDVMGTGLGARPFANTDIFCFADPNTPMATLPAGVIHPRRSAQRVVAGVRDYGNRMGIPTVNGAVYFDQRYIGNPLVFCGTVGIMPREFAQKGHTQPGDRIVVLGGRTGRDGIHGATFSSDVVTNTHADEFSHAVQIGNAITEKKMLDVILQARDYDAATRGRDDAATDAPSLAASPRRPVAASGPLYHALTDCGAGGLSSAIGEMGEKTGAAVELHKVPLKYEGLSYAEIWISEAQERMVLAVPPENVATLLELCAREDVEATDIGVFDGTGKLTLFYAEKAGDSEVRHAVAQLDMSFIHDGIPKPVRKAVYCPPAAMEPVISPPKADAGEYAKILHRLLRLPTIASKHWIIRQYDHEVQGGTIITPLVGAKQDGPGDAAVMRPVLDSPKAVALANGCQPRYGDIDPYQMALNGIDEALRNIVCVGGNPDRTAILDNFCWPKCTDPLHLGALVRACQACYDGALAYGTPFVSGKDSLNNEFITDKGERIQIPYTLLISAMSVLDDVTKCITMDAKTPGNQLLIVGLTKRELGGSRYYELFDQIGATVPQVDLKTAPAVLRAVAGLISAGLVRSAHDCSEGGMAVALAEMLFAGGVGAHIDLAGVPCAEDADADEVLCFSESPTRIVLEIEPANFDPVARALKAANIRFGVLGVVTAEKNLKIRSTRAGYLMDEPVEALKQSWLKTLDW